MRDFEVIEEFERRIAEYAHAPHAVAVDSCTAALFLCCKRLRVDHVTLPARTYCSLPAAVIHAGGEVSFEDFEWHGWYRLRPYPIWDSALRFRRGMFNEAQVVAGPRFVCVSFQYRKHLKIGRGGAILTDDEQAAAWFKLARFNGRESFPVGRGGVRFPGWHLFMEPERAARGIELMRYLPDDPPDQAAEYPDLRLEEAYRA